jgi:hypothetical protein
MIRKYATSADTPAHAVVSRRLQIVTACPELLGPLLQAPQPSCKGLQCIGMKLASGPLTGWICGFLLEVLASNRTLQALLRPA